ncbi:hypothetical protein C0971_14780 [Bacillus methanolicus]|uniref:hypothetical protein n=1 Tax=Bacillus methanolicus TaxID=1471 RepID=UPI00200E4812|nr:hypothetical protein [Bacillus methanolicus]UQD53144.1 hypothetical protein C0971_14780 [Bacillus methanolicus]
MFGWDFHNSKSDRIKLFLFIFAVFLVVGFTVSAVFRSMNKEVATAVEQNPKYSTESIEQVDLSDLNSEHSESLDGYDQINEYEQTEHFSEETLNETKEIAVQFAKAFHTYSADEPMKYLENAKPYMTDALYEKMKRNGRREVLERSYLTVTDIQVTPVVNKSSVVVRWNVMVTGEAKSVDGTTSETEDWYLVGLREVDGEWKVEDVRVNVPN